MEKNRKDIEILSEYTRVSSPDIEKLAALIYRAKGAKRSMSRFAQDCGVNPSTLSRIVNQKTVRANKDELILAIARNAEPDSRITLDMLMQAHGKVKRNSADEDSKAAIKSKETAKDIINTAILKSGYTLKLPTVSEVTDTESQIALRPDWLVQTNAISDQNIPVYWEFQYIAAVPAIGKQPEIGQAILRQMFLTYLGSFYLRNTKPERLSFIMTNEEIFDIFLRITEDVTTTHCFSAILADTGNGTVKKEVPLKNSSNAAFLSIFDELKNIPDTDNNNGQDFYFENLIFKL